MATNFSKKNLATLNDKYATTMKALEKGVKYDNTIEGVLSHITKMWNKGYGEAIKSQCGISKPSGFSVLLKKLAKGEGLDARMYATETDKEGNSKLVLGLWNPKTLHNESEEAAVLNADGKVTYPTICTLDDKGKRVAVKVDAIKKIKWTPENAILLVVQNDALKEGLTMPCTEEDFFATHMITNDNIAVKVDVPTMESEEPIADAIAIGA